MIARGLVLLLLAAAPLALTRGLTSATPGNLLIARDRTEPFIAVDPHHPGTIVVSTNTDYNQPVGGAYPTSSFASHDGGRSFSWLPAPFVSPYTTGADTSVAIDRQGTLFYTYLGETPAYCSGGRSAVVVTHSIDGGRSYRQAHLLDSDPADDKPFMAVESTHSGPSHVFVSWTRFHDSPSSSDIWYSRSTDGGVHFSSARRLFTTRGDNVGSVPEVGPHGRVYVFWMSYPDVGDTSTSPGAVLVRVSHDDGTHFGPVQTVAGGFERLPFRLAPGSLRVLSAPAAAVAPGGRVYVAWAQVGSRQAGGRVSADIMLARSIDGGGHWSSPVRVNDSRNGDRFMPALSVLADRSVGVAFYDRRDGAGLLDVYAARVRFGDAAQVSHNVRVTAGVSRVSDIQYLPPGSTCFLPGRFFGDYIGAAGDSSGSLCVVWADTQLHIAGESDIWFARVRFRG